MKSNTLTLVISALVVAVGAYWYFFTGTGNEPSLTTTTFESDSEAQTQFQTLVSQLESISFDTDIFSEPRFMALVDLATPVTPEEAGRSDPFAPVPGVSGK